MLSFAPFAFLAVADFFAVDFLAVDFFTGDFVFGFALRSRPTSRSRSAFRRAASE